MRDAPEVPAGNAGRHRRKPRKRRCSRTEPNPILPATASIQRASAVLAFFSLWLPDVFAAERPRTGRVGSRSGFASHPSRKSRSRRKRSWPSAAYTCSGTIPRWSWRAASARCSWRTKPSPKADDIGVRPGLSFVNETAAATAKHVVLTISPDGTVDFDRDSRWCCGANSTCAISRSTEALKIEMESFAFPLAR